MNNVPDLKDWPEGAEYLIDWDFIKWIDGTEYNFTEDGWIKADRSWSLKNYIDSGFEIHKRPNPVEHVSEQLTGVPPLRDWPEWATHVLRKAFGGIEYGFARRVSNIFYEGEKNHVVYDTKFWSIVETRENLESQEQASQKTINKYSREIKRGVYVDVYDVLEAFCVTNPATAHAIKKLLAAGERGYKNAEQDLREAIGSIERAIELENGL